MKKIETIDKVTDALGNVKRGYTKMYVSYDNVDADGNIIGQQASRMLVVSEPGYLFGVKEHIPKQYKKMIIQNGELYLRDGETLDDEVVEKTYMDGIYDVMEN